MRVVPGRTDHVVVVGAGLAGLSTALRLAGAGREVTVLEREPVPGGRNGLLVDGGYRFDTGPTVLTMPELVADALGCVGERLDDWLTLHRLDPAYRARFADGSQLDIRADPEATATGIAELCGPAEADGFRRFAAWAEQLYRLERPAFIDRNFDRPTDLLGPELVRLARLGGFRRLQPRVAEFVHDPRLQRVLTFQSMYAGLSPYRALALYGVIAYLDTIGGVYFPAGGMHAVPTALAAVAAKHGVQFHYGTTVSRVVVEHGRARGVLTEGGERVPADAVVLTVDLPVAYRQLLHRRPRRVQRSPSAFLMLVGAPQQKVRPAHHTIHFATAWRRSFTELAAGQLMSDPSLLVTTPTVTDPSLAPAGRESYYVLVPVPTLDATIDWHRLKGRYRDECFARLAGLGYQGLDEAEVLHLTSPAEWRAVGLDGGAPFAAAHTLRQTGPFRPGNLARGVAGVVFAGSGTQPGVGVPMCLLSGRLAAERIVGPVR